MLRVDPKNLQTMDYLWLYTISTCNLTVPTPWFWGTNKVRIKYVILMKGEFACAIKAQNVKLVFQLPLWSFLAHLEFLVTLF